MENNSYITVLSKNDLSTVEGEIRISHHTLAERLDVRASDLLRVIETLVEEDESFHALRRSAERVEHMAGFSTKEHVWLNEPQAISVTLESRAKRRHRLRNEIIAVFLAVKHAKAFDNIDTFENVDAKRRAAILNYNDPLSFAFEAAEYVRLLPDDIRATTLNMLHTAYYSSEEEPLSLYAQAQYMSASQIGGLCSPVCTAKEVNTTLESLGFLIKKGAYWVITRAGKVHGKTFGSYNKWLKSIVVYIQQDLDLR